MEFQYKIVSSMCKVFADGENARELEDKRMTGLKGETLSYQIAYYWGGERKERGCIAVDSPIKDRVHVRTVNLVPCEYPCHMKRDDGYLAVDPGMYPDRLSEVPKWGFPLVSGQWRCLWIDVELDESAEAGEYPVKVVLSKDGETLGEAEMVCEVLDATLPKLSIPYTEWFHSDCLADYYGVEVFSDRYWEIVEAFVREAAKHRCNMLLTPVFTPPLDTAVGGERRTVQLVDVTAEEGKYSFGFENFRRWVRMALDCGILYFEISHLFSQWGAKAAPKVMAVKDGKYQQIFGWDTDSAKEEYRDFLHQFLTALKQELKELGIEDRAYFHISDEPEKAHMESFRKAWESVAEDLEGFQVIDALSDYGFYREGLVRQPVCAVNHMEPFMAERPKRLWGYYCTAQCVDVTNRFIVQPGQRTRILGVQLYKYQLDGFLHWGYNFYNSEHSLYPIDPYRCTDAGGAFPSGDPFLVYPGKDGKPESSMRQMHMDEAMTDYCAFKALEKLVGRDKVMEYIDEEKVAFDEFPQDEEYLIRLRKKVNQAIKDAL
ncbi:MAG: DUF4091 domain-containing protein [Dorea sp.]|nr:DUF4091 domain-containing protein [Dorea sp.]MCI9614080.1 DUF4091 domain-containing protein [Dorea sp.]